MINNNFAMTTDNEPSALTAALALDDPVHQQQEQDQYQQQQQQYNYTTGFDEQQQYYDIQHQQYDDQNNRQQQQTNNLMMLNNNDGQMTELTDQSTYNFFNNPNNNYNHSKKLTDILPPANGIAQNAEEAMLRQLDEQLLLDQFNRIKKNFDLQQALLPSNSREQDFNEEQYRQNLINQGMQQNDQEVEGLINEHHREYLIDGIQLNRRMKFRNNYQNYQQQQQDDEQQLNGDFDNQTEVAHRRNRAFDLSQLFTEQLPVLGQVPLMFYIPKSRGAGKLKSLIHQYGGIVIPQNECCALQIMPDTNDDLTHQFGKGFIFSFKWIYESIASQRVLSPENFRMHHLEGKKEVSFSRTKFTIREIMKIFEVIQKNPQRRTKNPVYWGQSIQRGYFPGRSVHSINAQWQKFCTYENMDSAIMQALRFKMPYCVSFREIPDEPAIVNAIIDQLKTKKHEVMQLERLRHNIFKNDLPPQLRQQVDEYHQPMLSEDEEDEDYNPQRLTYQLLHQQPLAQHQQDTNKKIEQMLMIKEEPKSYLTTKSQGNLLGRRTRIQDNNNNLFQGKDQEQVRNELPVEINQKRQRGGRRNMNRKVNIKTKQSKLNCFAQKPQDQQDDNIQTQQLIDMENGEEDTIIHDDEECLEDNDDNTSVFGLGFQSFSNSLIQKMKQQQQQQLQEEENNKLQESQKSNQNDKCKQDKLDEDQKVKSVSQSSQDKDNREQWQKQLNSQVKAESFTKSYNQNNNSSMEASQTEVSPLSYCYSVDTDSKSKLSNYSTTRRKPLLQKRSMSYRYSEIDFERQLRYFQDQRSSTFQRRHPQVVLGEEDYNPFVYTQKYRDQFWDGVNQIRVVIQKSNDSEEDSFDGYKRRVIKKTFNVKNFSSDQKSTCDNNTSMTANQQNFNNHTRPAYHEFTADESLVPQFSRLIFLHKKYCDPNQKSIEDLQKDLFSLNDDIKALELMLRGEKVQQWSEIEDHTLRKYGGDIRTIEFQLLIKMKGPEEVQKRKIFLGI
eukprot:403341744